MHDPADARNALLSDSEATLRQVNGALSDFTVTDSEGNAVDGLAGADQLAELVKMLVTTYTEIMQVIASLRASRGLLEEASMQRLKSTGLKLAEVTSATEMAANGMLDGLDRAISLVDRLDEFDGETAEDAEAGQAGQVRDDLRDELHTLIGLLQFQDITSQQLGYASTVLTDVEERMLKLSAIFTSGSSLGGLTLPTLPGEESFERPETCDPDASTENAEARQALADEIFTTPSGG